MKKSCLLFLIIMGLIVTNTFAQNEIPLNSIKNEFKILSKTRDGFKVSLNMSSFRTMNVSTPQGLFTELIFQGFSKRYDNGKPQLPMMTKLLEIPYGADIEVTVISFDEETVSLPSNGLPNKVIPSQPSVSKSADPSEVPFYYDQIYYLQNAYNSTPLVTVETRGIMRGVQIGALTIAPIRYNPAQNTLKIYNNLVFEITFNNADYGLTDHRKSQYYSPVFEPAFGNLINYSPPSSKDVITKYPIKYVIVSLTSFQSSLQPFVQWKTKKGFTVVEQYYASAPATSTIKTYLQGLYNAGTPQDPAPSFVLFVGDVAQIPTNTGTTGSHPTDLYYCCYDGGSDYMPEMYYGRFSATNTAQLDVQINKTLQYEMYTMPKKTYLDTVVMIAGADPSFAPIWANGQINYGTSNYFNLAHGMYSYTHLYPASQSEDAIIRTEIGKGVAYANYTAHCSSSGWADPTFTTTHVPAMINQDKYGLMVGNCCLSNKFNDTECFGESLLRTANKGAVGYIGASNNSLWDEDYYWGVGNRSSIVVNPSYDANNLGAYDGVFHDHGEAKTKWFITNSQVFYAGNLAVEASTSGNNVYYWEIYHLMGDPSVMTYFSMPDPLTVSYVDPQVVGVTTLVVNTEEDAYVAISDDGVLLDAQLAPVGGVVTLTFPAFTMPDTADIVVTKQNKEPYIGTVRFVAPSIPLDASVSNIIVPESSYACDGVNIDPEITLLNMGTLNLTSCTILYHIDAQPDASFIWNGNLAPLASATVTLPAIMLTSGSHTFTAASSLPNGSPDGNTANDSFTKDYSVSSLTVSADFTASQTDICSAPGQVTFTNNSANAQSYLWDFGDGNSSTDQDPSHVYANLGNYTVMLTADAGVCGNDVETKVGYITVGSDVPTANDDSRCGTGSVTLTAAGTGTLTWYDALTGGSQVGTGTSFVTPSLSTTTNYYVENVVASAPQYVGSTNNNANGGYFTSAYEHWLVFDCYEACTLVSVEVNANTAGNRTIELQNSSGTTLQSATINIPSGISRITLNFNIPVGTDLRLAGPLSPGLYRNNAAVSYPYTLAGLISITASSASTPGSYYYYFYDWEVQSPDCSSARAEATAFILSAPPSAGFSFTPTGLNVAFTNTSINGMSYYWDFGDGTNSTDENPAHTYASNSLYVVMLITTNDCGSDTAYLNVDLSTVSIAENNGSMIQVYPNPAKGQITLYLNGLYANLVELYDVTGRLVMSKANVFNNISVDISENGSGIYYFRVTSGEAVYTCKFTNL